MKAKSVALAEWNQVCTQHKFVSEAYQAGFARAIELTKQRMHELAPTEKLSVEQLIHAIENVQWKR